MERISKVLTEVTGSTFGDTEFDVYRRAGANGTRVRKVIHLYILSNLEILFREIYDYKQCDFFSLRVQLDDKQRSYAIPDHIRPKCISKDRTALNEL